MPRSSHAKSNIQVIICCNLLAVCFSFATYYAPITAFLLLIILYRLVSDFHSSLLCIARLSAVQSTPSFNLSLYTSSLICGFRARKSANVSGLSSVFFLAFPPLRPLSLRTLLKSRLLRNNLKYASTGGLSSVGSTLSSI